MPELDAIPAEARQRLEEIGSADLIIGILNTAHDHEIGTVVKTVGEVLRELSQNLRAVVVHSPSDEAPERHEAARENESVHVVPWPLLAPNTSLTQAGSVSDGYRSIFALGESLGARGYGVIASSLETVTSQWISRLVEPVLNMDFDLVAPCYARQKLEGLLNNSILRPLMRALYGRRIRNPLGPDFGFSAKLLRRLLYLDSGLPNRLGSPVLFASEAACGGFQVCQAHIGERHPPQIDLMNLSSILADVLGPVFLDVERNAPFWQKVRGSHAVRAFGEPIASAQEDGSVDVRRLVESFQLGSRNLQEVWGVVLPPATLFEVRKLARLAPDEFHMPDELWVRIIYDFALGHRLRTISRDHLLLAITPLYLGWTASYALEVERSTPDMVEYRLEQLCDAYEAGKTYLLSRWRWPDRFNP